MTVIAAVQRIPSPDPQATIDTTAQSRRSQAEGYANDQGMIPDAPEQDIPEALINLMLFAERNGDISDMLPLSVVEKLGTDAVRLWRRDDGTRTDWKEVAERALSIASQDDEDDAEQSDGLWDDSADIHYPLLTTASQQFAARAGPELIRGDQVVGVKVFAPPAQRPTPTQIAQDSPPPQSPAAQAIAGQALQQAAQQQEQMSLVADARRARAERVKHYLNWLIFYQMDDWEGDTDLLLHQIPIMGAAFKKVYYGATGLCSDYVSALRLVVHNDTKTIGRCPRITQEFEVYPYEVRERIAAGIYRDVEDRIRVSGDDPEEPRTFIEQHTMADLDGDGATEPYIITVDVQTSATLRVEPAYTPEDIVIDARSRRVVRIDRWNPFAEFMFLPHPKGKFYGIGFGKLLDSITDSVDTSINQLLDAGTAQIAGGGFIGSGVRLQGSGQGGAIYFRPGEYQTVGTPGGDLQNAIWERTVPHPSAVTYQLLELLLAAAKDVASVKDVITGEAPSTAPVGTTLALQNQALQVFSAIYKRVYRGFRDEFRLMYRTLKRWATDDDRRKYTELTGGDFDQDFSGDGTDIQPIADPAVVTKMQKMARIQAVIQLAESQVGQAAGMTQPKPAQELARDALDVMEYDRPDRLLADVPPNPIEVAKAQDLAATAQLKAADAQWRGVEAEKTGAEAQKAAAGATLAHAQSLREIGLAAKDTHDLHRERDRVSRLGMVAMPQDLMQPDEAQQSNSQPSPGVGP